MKFLRAFRNHGLAAPVLALGLTSTVLIVLVAYRVVASGSIRHAYLVWNLFLAWLPLGFALLARERFAARAGQWNWKFGGLSVAWLLFFPNAPYIFTDLVHVRTAWSQTFWVDLMLILLCALTGFLAGFLSLQIMHGLATRVWGYIAGWLFVTAVSGLAAFGVYLGRFVRLNSWDVLTNPTHLAYGTALGTWHLATQWNHLKFLGLFSLFLLLAYLMLFALTQQRHASATTQE